MSSILQVGSRLYSGGPRHAGYSCAVCRFHPCQLRLLRNDCCELPQAGQWVRLYIESSPVRELRFKTGEMTQQGLADRVGITRQTVMALEKNKYYP